MKHWTKAKDLYSYLDGILLKRDVDLLNVKIDGDLVVLCFPKDDDVYRAFYSEREAVEMLKEVMDYIESSDQ